MQTVSNTLRRWFLIHFVVDMLFGIPLLLFPTLTLIFFGFPQENLLLARLVGAALLGIGGASLFMHRAGSEAYLMMLNLKVIWSLAAIFAISVSLGDAPVAGWGFLVVYALFSVVWIRYRFFMP